MSLTKFEGIPVWFCFPGSPAERAGVREGDRLLAVNGMRMGDVFDYVTARGLDSRRINLTLLRGNSVHDLTVELDGSYRISPEALAGDEPDEKASSVLA
ncbi:MAG TPA: PDZ domain-containing protein [Polyangiales bacterium]